MFTEAERVAVLGQTRAMAHHAYDNYMQHAFPLDEADDELRTKSWPIQVALPLFLANFSSTYGLAWNV